MQNGFLRCTLFKTSSVFLSVLLLAFCICTSLVMAQQVIDLQDEDYKYGILQKIDSLLERNYVLPEMAKRYAEEFNKIYSSGAYNSYSNAEEFAEKVTEDLISITKDKHIKFQLIESSDIGENPASSLHHPIRYYHLGIKENTGFSKLEWIEGNIGYLDIRRFYYFADARDMVIAAMRFLSNAAAIIIDLRENGGGSGDYLSSYFLKHPTQLTGWFSREDNFLYEFWTTKEIGVERLTDVPLFLLTGKSTFSAAESFAYDMKVSRRVTIIGDSTKGGAHSVDLYKINDQFEIYIPTTRAINPITSANWEGTGVIPDIVVPSSSALDTAVVLAKIAGEEFLKRKEAKLKLAVDEMQIHLNSSERFFRKNKKVLAETALDSVFQIADENNLISEFFMYVFAYNYSSAEDEQILYAISKKRIEIFPKSAGAYQTLAYAYYKNNKKELAVDNFRKVLELEPDNRNAINMIKRIKSDK